MNALTITKDEFRLAPIISLPLHISGDSTIRQEIINELDRIISPLNEIVAILDKTIEIEKKIGKETVDFGYLYYNNRPCISLLGWTKVSTLTGECISSVCRYMRAVSAPSFSRLPNTIISDLLVMMKGEFARNIIYKILRKRKAELYYEEDENSFQNLRRAILAYVDIYIEFRRNIKTSGQIFSHIRDLRELVERLKCIHLNWRLRELLEIQYIYCFSCGKKGKITNRQYICLYCAHKSIV